MAKEPFQPIPARTLMAIIDKAIAERRHCAAEQWPGVVCNGCGNWTREVYRSKQTRDVFCPACAKKYGLLDAGPPGGSAP